MDSGSYTGDVEVGGPADVRELPGLNHLFQPSKTGAPTEYGKIEETIAPAALEVVSAWIKERK